MTDDAPKIASTLERTKLFMAACLMFLQAPLIFQRQNPNPFAALMFLYAIYIGLNVLRNLSTQVTGVGISQLTWRGRVQMRWEDVTTITRRNRSLVLTGVEGTVIVPTESFYDTQAAVDYLDSHLPKHLRRY
jgi:hypothetical protein